MRPEAPSQRSSPLAATLARGRGWVSLILVAVGILALAAALPSLAGFESEGAALRSAVAVDRDGDGVPDAVENALLGTRTDAGRGPGTLPEAWIARYELDPSDPQLAERSAPYGVTGDATRRQESCGDVAPLTLYEVYAYKRPPTWNETIDGAWDSGLDPLRADVAGSGVPYAWLLRYGLDPFDVAALDRVSPMADVAWTPREAFMRGLHPASRDGDGDGLDDEVELDLGTCPQSYSTAGSGIADGWLIHHGFDPLSPTIAFEDTDRDGLTNVEEFAYGERHRPGVFSEGLDPHRLSSRGGPIPDGWLVAHGLDPFDAAIHARVTEQDGEASITVLDEYLANRRPLWNESRQGPWPGGSDPRLADTDGDGLSDLLEIRGWTLRVDGVSKRVFSDPTRKDSDADGLTDAEEFAGKAKGREFAPTDPLAADTDFDGLSDGQELGVEAWEGHFLVGLDPHETDTDGDGLSDGLEARYWSDRHRSCTYLLTYPWGPEPRVRAFDVMVALGGPPSDPCSLLAPVGDPDRDGFPNLVDPDADGDGLLDAWEAVPARYDESPFASEDPRRATDPVNPDTDSDGLPDVWEIRHGVYDAALGGWNLDPSLWSSFGDNVGDGDRDLDGDGATLYVFERDGTRREHAFVATNRVEFEAGSHPNLRSTSPDGLPDGWKILWGTHYLGLAPEALGAFYPGAPGPLALPSDRPVPRIGSDDATSLGTARYVRLVEAGSPIVAGEVIVGTENGGRQRVEGTLAMSYHVAAIAATNPYLDDTDGDGAPDAWEVAWGRLGSGLAKVSPIVHDGLDDVDGDGLANVEEARHGTDPYERDSDRGGAQDLLEVRVQLDPLDASDDARALASGADSDGDGVTDFAEILGRVAGPSNALRKTDPLDPDTDRDGLLDGRALSKVLGRPLDATGDEELLARLEDRGLVVVRTASGGLEVFGEDSFGTDPGLSSTAGTGVPDGWSVLHGLSPRSAAASRDDYAYGRPSWWNESLDGVWRWGLSPKRTQPPSRDFDGDGLDDYNGEDPIPFANRRNVLERGHPLDPGLDPLERLSRSQRYGDSDRESILPTREAVTLHLDPLPKPLVADGSSSFRGRAEASGRPAAGVPVVLVLGSPPVTVGVAVTGADGVFSGSIELAETLAAPEGSEGFVVFGATDGRGVSIADIEALHAIDPSSPLEAYVWSYNTSRYSPERQRDAGRAPDGRGSEGFLGSRSPVQHVEILLPTHLRWSAPDRGLAGSTVTINVSLADARERPVPNAAIEIGSPARRVITDAQGKAAFEERLPGSSGLHRIPLAFGDARSGLLPAASSVDVRVLDPVEIVVVPPVLPYHPGESVPIEGVVKDGRGRGVPGAELSLAGERDLATSTGPSGAFRFLLALSPHAQPGSRVVEIAFGGNETLAAAASRATFRLEGRPTLEAWPVVTPFDRNFTVEGRLLASGLGLRDRTLSAKTPDGRLATAVTAEDGAFRFEFDARALGLGSHLFDVSFSDPVEGRAEVAVPVLVHAPSKLDFTVRDFARGARAIASGSLQSAAGGPLEGQIVDVRLGDLTTRAVTDVSGSFLVEISVPADAPLGPADIVASFEGSPDRLHDPVSVQTSASLKDRPVIVVTDGPVLLSDPFVRGRIQALAGHALAGAEIRASGFWGEVSMTTDRQGAFRFAVPKIASRPFGPFEARFEIDASPDLEQADVSKTLTLKDRGRLVVEAPQPVLVAGEVVFRYRLLDTLDRVRLPENVDVTVGGERVEPLLRDGEARVVLPAHLEAGVHSWRLVVESEAVEADPATGTIEVREPTTVTLVEAPPIEAGRAAVVEILVATAEGPLGNRTLWLVGAGPQPIAIATDAEGRARVPIPGLSPGETLHVFHRGEGSFGDSSVALSLAVVASPRAAAAEPPWVAIGLVALALGGGLWWQRHRRRSGTVEDVLQEAARRLAVEHPDVHVFYHAYRALLGLAGLSESEADPVTFNDLLHRVVRSNEATEADMALVVRVFNEVVYAPHLLDDDTVRACAPAFARLAAETNPEGRR